MIRTPLLLTCCLLAGLLAACGGPFDYVISLQNEKGEAITQLEQEVPLYLISAGGTFEGHFDSAGNVRFSALPRELKGALVTFQWDDKYWVPATPSQRLHLEGDSKVMVLKPNPKLAVITGLIRNDTDFLPGVTVSCCMGVTAVTNANGRYVLQVPREKQQPRQLITAYLEGYEFYQRFFDVTQDIPAILLIPKE